MARRYTISDGKLVLQLTPDEDGWDTVTSPTDPALVTMARTVPEAFEMARDGLAALASSRADERRWTKADRARRSPARKTA
jgi:hypothetical protein